MSLYKESKAVPMGRTIITGINDGEGRRYTSIYVIEVYKESKAARGKGVGSSSAPSSKYIHNYEIIYRGWQYQTL